MINILPNITLPSVAAVDISSLQFGTLVEILMIAELILIPLSIIGFCIRLWFNGSEREIIRFTLSLTNAISNAISVVGVIRDAPSTLVSVFYVVMFCREFFSFWVDRKFYQFWYPPKRRKISNRFFNLFFFFLYGTLVAIGITKVIFQGIN